MPGVSRFELARVVLGVVALGFGFGSAAFGLTSMHERYLYLGPLCATEDSWPGFDPWTGLPYGRRFWFECPPGLGDGSPGRWVHLEPPADIAGRRAVPLPLGIALGTAVSAILVARSRRSSGPASRLQSGLDRLDGEGSVVLRGVATLLVIVAPLLTGSFVLLAGLGVIAAGFLLLPPSANARAMTIRGQSP
jgi:hypothetical protein